MSARMSRYGREEDDFARLLREVRDGTASFASIQEHSEFQRRARQICRSIARKYRDAGYDAEDLFADACVKMLMYGNAPRTRGLVLEEKSDEEDFFRWFYVLVLNTFHSRLRKATRFREYGPPGSLVPIEECASIEDSSVNLEGEYLLREFQEFIDRSLPIWRRRAVELRLEGYSFREIAAVLNSDGIKRSHAGIRKSIMDSLNDFFAPTKLRMKRVS